MMIKLIKKAYTKHLNVLVEHYWQIYKFDMSPNHSSHNNEGDAFKHCMFQAELTFWFGETIAKFFGDMHEDDNPYNTEAEREMDLHNNEWGRIIGDSYRVFINYLRLRYTYNTIAENIMEAMKQGKLITKC